MRLQKIIHSILLWVLSTFVCSKHNHLLLVPVFLFCSIWHASYKPVVKKSAHIQGTISFQTLNYQVKNKVRFILLSGFYYKKNFCTDMVIHRTKLFTETIQFAKHFLENSNYRNHRLRTPREEIAFTARPKIQSQSQIFRYGQSIFCLPHWPSFSDIFDLCLHP